MLCKHLSILSWQASIFLLLAQQAWNGLQEHRTIRMTPAMEAGITDRIWSVVDLVSY